VCQIIRTTMCRIISKTTSTPLLSAGSTSTSRAITHCTQIKGWLKVGSDPSEYPESASARLSVHKIPFREVSPCTRNIALALLGSLSKPIHLFTSRGLMEWPCDEESGTCRGPRPETAPRALERAQGPLRTRCFKLRSKTGMETAIQALRSAYREKRATTSCGALPRCAG
jgi:hypothetical protein